MGKRETYLGYAKAENYLNNESGDSEDDRLHALSARSLQDGCDVGRGHCRR
jgi:hypothetical protein